MRTLTLAIVFFFLCLVANGQKTVVIKTPCLGGDSLKIFMEKREIKSRNFNEITWIKTLQETIFLHGYGKRNDSLNNLDYLKVSICFFSQKFEKIKSKKNKKIFLEAFKGLQKYHYEKRTNTPLYFFEVYLLNTNGIKEVDNIMLARDATLKYLDFFNKSQRVSNIFYYDGEKEKIAEYKKNTEVGIIMLINIYKSDINKFYAVSDFQKALKILNLHLYSKEELNRWINIIGQETNIWVNID